MQPGPIYFLPPRKCSIFGINCEAIPRQINFLPDESGKVGNWANVVISRLHFFFRVYGLGEKYVYLHAGNCAGQNKNNAVIEYLMWRVLTGRHTDVTYSFLVVGHTKFLAGASAYFKRLFKRTRVSSMGEIANVVERSASCNKVQVVCNEDTGVVPTYDWTSFLQPHFQKIAGIKKLHHFRYSASSPGTVYVKTHADAEESALDLLREDWQPSPSTLPQQIQSLGLSDERKWYLYERIRPFCSHEHRDTVCPEPSVPNPKRRRNPAPEED